MLSGEIIKTQARSQTSMFACLPPDVYMYMCLPSQTVFDNHWADLNSCVWLELDPDHTGVWIW